MAQTIKVEVHLPEDVFKHLELRAAIDDLRPGEAIAHFLTELARAAMARPKPTIDLERCCLICGRLKHSAELCKRCYTLSLKGMTHEEIRAKVEAEEEKAA